MHTLSYVLIILAYCLMVYSSPSTAADAIRWEMQEESAVYSGDEHLILITGAAGDGAHSLLVGHNYSENAENTSPLTLLVSPEGVLVNLKVLSAPYTGVFPRVAFGGTKYLIAWSSFISDNDCYLFGQFANTDGEPEGSAFLIKAAQGIREIGGIAYNSSSFLVVWTDRRDGNDDIYCQLISPSGEILGMEIPVIIAPFNQKDPAVASTGGSFLVTWNDGKRLGQGHGEDIYGQIISGAGELTGTPFVISSNDIPSDNPMSIAASKDGYFVVWMEETGGYDTREWDIFGRMISSDGEAVGNEIPLCVRTGGQYYPSVAYDGEGFLLAWTDMSNDLNQNGRFDPEEGTGNDIHGLFLDSDGMPAGGQFVISAAAYDQFGAGVCFNGGRYLVAWTDMRSYDYLNFDGMQYGQVYGVTFTKATPTAVTANPPSAVRLFPNYPNPFNPRTAIPFSVAAPGHVRLTVCNAAGQEIATLVDSYVESGEHTVVWEGGTYSNGLYFCRLEAGGSIAVSKMMILK